MKKLYLLILLSMFTFSNTMKNLDLEMEKQRIKEQYGEKYLVIGSINNLVGKGEVKVKPDIIITEFELKTEADTLDKASNENAKLMTEFKNYLLSLGIKSDNIETSRYTRSDGTVNKEENEKKEKYKTIMDVRINSLEADKFYKVVEILEKEGIKQLNRNNYSSNYYYTYRIESPSTTEKQSKQSVKEKYDRIEKKLQEIGIREIVPDNYQTTETEAEKKKVYYVTHTFRVKMPSSIDMGKVLKKGQSLKIKNPGNLSYDVSDNVRKKATLDAYDRAMSEIYDKSKVILKNRGYELGDIKYINDNAPYWDYGNKGKDTIMMQNSALVMTDSKISGPDIPFSVAQEMKITVTLTASYDILKLKK